MKFIVTDIEFDTDNELTFDEEIALHDTALGIWEVEDEDELVDKISDATGWCIRNIDYTETKYEDIQKATVQFTD